MILSAEEYVEIAKEAVEDGVSISANTVHCHYPKAFAEFCKLYGDVPKKGGMFVRGKDTICRWFSFKLDGVEIMAGLSTADQDVLRELLAPDPDDEALEAGDRAMERQRDLEAEKD